MEKRTIIRCRIAILFIIFILCILEYLNGTKNITLASSQVEFKERKFSVPSIQQINYAADFITIYKNTKELVLDADIIVEGEIIKSQYFDFNHHTFTCATLQISKSFNNKLNTGDRIEFIEVGGVTTKGNLKWYTSKKMNIPTNEMHQPIEILLDGASTSKSGERVLLFAKDDKENFFNMKEKVYIPLNSYQGKFIIDKNNQVKRHIAMYDQKRTSLQNKSSLIHKIHSFEYDSVEKANLETTLMNMEQQIIDLLHNVKIKSTQ